MSANPFACRKSENRLLRLTDYPVEYLHIGDKHWNFVGDRTPFFFCALYATNIPDIFLDKSVRPTFVKATRAYPPDNAAADMPRPNRLRPLFDTLPGIAAGTRLGPVIRLTSDINSTYLANREEGENVATLPISFTPAAILFEFWMQYFK